MKAIYNFMVAIMIGCILLSCEKNEEDLTTTQSIEIDIDSDGGEYTFASNTIDILVAPDEFYAEVVNNTIVGKYAGTTNATIQSGNTKYECKINVSASYSYYIDMAIYLGWSKSDVEKLYGSYISINKDTYYYNPLSSYLAESKVAFTYDDSDQVIACASYFTLYQMTYVIKHLQQRYATYGISNSVAYYGNAFEMDDASMIVMCGIEDAYVVYADASIINN